VIDVACWHFADLGSAIFVTAASRMRRYVAIPVRLPTGELTDWRDEAKLPKEFPLSNGVTFPRKSA
jgi:hypothetical protein